MLSNLFHYFWSPKWAVAHINYPNPEARNFPTALMGCIIEGGTLVFVG